ncbi:hypothetical protein SLA2020_112000 [Shorea laevis]
MKRGQRIAKIEPSPCSKWHHLDLLAASNIQQFPTTIQKPLGLNFVARIPQTFGSHPIDAIRKFTVPFLSTKKPCRTTSSVTLW